MNRLRHAWRQVHGFLSSTTGRLAASYLAVIMVMSLGFSLVLYATSTHALYRQPPPEFFRQAGDSPDGDEAYLPQPRVRDYLVRRGEETRKVMMEYLVVLNAATLVAGAGLGYYLARRTLQPIEANIEAQSQFVGDASHELRTPLTALQTTNEVALRNRKLTLTEARQALRHNIEAVAKLQALADGLLKLTQQDSGVLPMQELSLQEVAGEAINQVLAQAQAKAMAINDEVPAIRLAGHPASLTQAVVVLLDNAIKYGRPGSTVSLAGGQAGKYAFLRVADQGPGIRPSDMPRIFDRFYRADQSRSSRHVGGHGIGLSLAQKIVAQHRGRIEAASEVGRGSTFTIFLPLA